MHILRKELDPPQGGEKKLIIRQEGEHSSTVGAGRTGGVQEGKYLAR